MTDLRATISTLKVKACASREVTKKLEDAITALRDTCEHSWRDAGYDPRGGGTQHSLCTLCGLEKSE